ncbi:MAG: hypothetical protein Q8O66_03305, partial [bacterium]|nr:hypothetical protein [bacterium]
MKNKKVLVLYASLGAGHKMAAKAIVEAFEEKYPNVGIKSVDVLDFGFQAFKRGLPFTFDYVTSKTPFLYKWTYDYYNHQSRYKFFNYASDKIIKKSKFVKFIK